MLAPMQLRPWLPAVCLLACSTWAAGATDYSAGEQLTRWVSASGGSADVTVGEVPGASGLRGVLAARSFAPGEAVISLPTRLAIGLGLHTFTPQELAARLLRKRHAKRDWAASYEAFWASVPPVGSVYAKENWRAEHVAALQDQKLADYVMTSANLTRLAHAGQLPWRAPDTLPPLAGIGIDLAEFGHWAALCASYSHVFPMAGSAPGRFLLPLLHLVNHDGAAPNVAVERDSAAGVFKGVALRDIAAGEQVTYRYNWGILRPDVAIANYFFTQPADPPLRCALDLPAGELEVEFADGDDVQYLPRSSQEAQTEAQRLGAVLAAFPTSQAQDQALLAAGHEDAGGPADWQTRRILEFRIERKRALRYGAQVDHCSAAEAPLVVRRLGRLGSPQNSVT